MNPESVSLLIARGATVDALDADGATPLMVAAIRVNEENLPTLQCLIAAGADIDATDFYGRTALVYAASEGQAEAMRALLAAGADSTANDSAGLTAEQILRRFLREREPEGDSR